MAKSSVSVAPIQIAKALGEYALAVYFLAPGQSGADEAFASWSEAMKKILEVPRDNKICKDAMARFGHVTGFLAKTARDGSPPDHTADGGEWAPPSRGLFTKYSNEMAEWYRPDGETGLLFMMSEYAEAVGNATERLYWLLKAMDEGRRSGDTIALPVILYRRIPDLIAENLIEEAVEASVKAARGMSVNRVQPQDRHSPQTPKRDLQVEFTLLSVEQRQEADRFALIGGVIPLAFRIVQISLSDLAFAAQAAQRVASMCRLLAAEGMAYQDLWRRADEIFTMAAGEQVNPFRLIDRAHEVGHAGLNEVHALGYILATWHLPPGEVLKCQLSCGEWFLKMYPPTEPTHRQVYLPYIESYWLHVARTERFHLRSPSVTAEAIEAAARAPHQERVRKILRAAALGFPHTGTEQVRQWLARD